MRIPRPRERGTTRELRPSRSQLLIGLGVLWLIDAALQLQPYMMSQTFFGAMFESANVGLPSWLEPAEYHLVTLGRQPVLWDAVIAGVQLALGVLLVSRRLVRPALAASVAWSLVVWVVGEGMGGLMLTGATPVTGAPGPALVYALAALLVWPARPDHGPAVADTMPAGPWSGRLLWSGLWAGTALLLLEGANRLASAMGDLLTGTGNGEPGWLAGLNQRVGDSVGGSGGLLSILLVVVQVGVAAGILFRPTRRAALVGGAVLAGLYGLAGQDLGGLFTGRANDLGTGPVLLLVAASLWPRSAHDPGVAEGVPARLGPDGQTVG